MFVSRGFEGVSKSRCKTSDQKRVQQCRPCSFFKARRPLGARFPEVRLGVLYHMRDVRCVCAKKQIRSASTQDNADRGGQRAAARPRPEPSRRSFPHDGHCLFLAWAPHQGELSILFIFASLCHLRHNLVVLAGTAATCRSPRDRFTLELLSASRLRVQSQMNSQKCFFCVLWYRWRLTGESSVMSCVMMFRMLRVVCFDRHCLRVVHPPTRRCSACA